MPLTLGTAGHIDHGKTTLVRRLTGVDTDRLPEEKARGISIALGYAPLTLPSGRVLSVVDVPGHERFVRTMVAGATGIDLFLMGVAADDGVMPQTREHAGVLAALGVTDGGGAITKTDLAAPARARAEAAELLPGVEIVVDDVPAALDRAAARVASRTADGPLRLHVDRVFSVRGAGTVVTGTLWSGTAARGDHVTILPAGERARIRSVEVHDERVERAQAGQRVALNLVGARVERGDVIATDAIAASFRVDVALQWATPEARPDSGARIAVHHGTRESAARLVELGGRFFQLRLEQPIVPGAGDRLVIRSLAPPDTLGGGVVLDPQPRRPRAGRRRLRPRAGGPGAEPRPARPPRAARARRARARGRPGEAGAEARARAAVA